jgi:hypothetical protein
MYSKLRRQPIRPIAFAFALALGVSAFATHDFANAEEKSREAAPAAILKMQLSVPDVQPVSYPDYEIPWNGKGKLTVNRDDGVHSVVVVLKGDGEGKGELVLTYKHNNKSVFRDLRIAAEVGDTQTVNSGKVAVSVELAAKPKPRKKIEVGGGDAPLDGLE